jgi:hypothetical protein
MSEQRHARPRWKQLGVGLGTALLAAAAGWGTVQADHPPAPTPVCIQENGPVASSPYLAHQDEGRWIRSRLPRPPHSSIR